MAKTDEPLEPHYPIRPNDQALLYEGPIQLPHASSAGAGRIWAQWSPEPRIRFSAEFSLEATENLPAARTGWQQLQIVNRGVRTRGFIDHTKNFGTEVDGFLGATTIRSRKRISTLKFHLVNFPPMVRLDPLRKGSHEWNGRLALVGGGWEVIVDLTADHSRLMRHLRSSKGIAVTYVGQAAREDGRTFSTSEATNILDCLQWMFSFIRGAQAAPWLVVGFDKDGAVCFEEWVERSVDPWRGVLSWFSTWHPEWLRHLFPLFVQRWYGAESDVLRMVVGYYLTANGNAPIEARIMLAQSGMELLGWWILTQESSTKRMSSHGYEDLAAAERLRRLLDWIRLPRQLPRSAGHLRSWASQAGPSDASQSLVRLRNWVTHPRRRGGHIGPPATVWPDAWGVTQRYLELLILRWLGYRLDYVNRLHARHANDTQHVPWR